MRRKEIVIPSKVFREGLEGLQKAQNSCRVVGQQLELEVAGKVFQVGVLMQDRALVFHEVGETDLKNIYWMRFTAIGLWWPPVKVFTCFTYF